MSLQPSYNDLFEPPFNYPDFSAQERLNSLVGLEEYKLRLTKILGLLINPKSLETWANKHHETARKVIDLVLRRPPLIVFEGDVGSGKTELAMAIGDAVARQQKISITLFPLSLSSRGQGRVGEMTKLISTAFEYTIQQAKKLKGESDKSRGGIILLVDEADALAQSRENSQMHHEDKAGVNAFIRGIDRIGNNNLPAAVIMCTNRIHSLDPAVKRRAAEIFTFHRPNKEQRLAVLEKPLLELGVDKESIDMIIKITGEYKNRQYGFTFSDLTQRLLPSIILDAYPDDPVCAQRTLEITKRTIPTPPFEETK